MRSSLPPTRLAFACLVLAAATARAQESHYEPLRLSRAIQVGAETLGSSPIRREPVAEWGKRESIPSFPFRQVAASESDAHDASAAGRKLAARSSAPRRSPERAAAPTPTAAIGTVASSLAIVLGLFAALVWFSKRFAPSGAAALPQEAVELLGRTPLDGRQTMQLIRVGNRLLLVALSAGGATTLTEITDPLEVEHLAGLCRPGKSNSSTAAFSRVLSQLAHEPADQSHRPRARGAA
jgi:flagellar biogenesis protein FliO